MMAVPPAEMAISAKRQLGTVWKRLTAAWRAAGGVEPSIRTCRAVMCRAAVRVAAAR